MCLNSCGSFKKCHTCVCFVCNKRTSSVYFTVKHVKHVDFWVTFFSFQSFMVFFASPQWLIRFCKTSLSLWWFLHYLWHYCASAKINYVKMMPLCQAELLFPKKVPFLISICWPSMDVWEHLSALSNGESLWIQTMKTDVSGLDSGTKTFTFLSHMYQYTPQKSDL